MESEDGLGPAVRSLARNVQSCCSEELRVLRNSRRQVQGGDLTRADGGGGGVVSVVVALQLGLVDTPEMDLHEC